MYIFAFVNICLKHWSYFFSFVFKIYTANVLFSVVKKWVLHLMMSMHFLLFLFTQYVILFVFVLRVPFIIICKDAAVMDTPTPSTQR